MAKKTLTEKVVELFDKEPDIEEQKKAYFAVKDLVTKNLEKIQAELTEKAEQTASIINRINGTSSY